jgi:hypothetical protein
VKGLNDVMVNKIKKLAKTVNVEKKLEGVLNIPSF